MAYMKFIRNRNWNCNVVLNIRLLGNEAFSCSFFLHISLCVIWIEKYNEFYAIKWWWWWCITNIYCTAEIASKFTIQPLLWCAKKIDLSTKIQKNVCLRYVVSSQRMSVCILFHHPLQCWHLSNISQHTQLLLFDFPFTYFVRCIEKYNRFIISFHFS